MDSRGNFVQLTDADWDRPPESLLIGEGVETTLTAMQVTGWPGIATGGAGMMAQLNPPSCQRYIILAGNGDGGQQAACASASRLLTGAEWSTRDADCFHGLRRKVGQALPIRAFAAITRDSEIAECKSYIVVSEKGPACPRCGRPMQIREHDCIRAKHLRQPYYYRRWYRCAHSGCNTTTVTRDELKVWNGEAACMHPPSEYSGGQLAAGCGTDHPLSARSECPIMPSYERRQ